MNNGAPGRIILEEVTKQYLDAERTLTILDDVSFSFPHQGTCAIVGRSGIGKSTLLHLLGALDLPTKGRITIGGVEVTALTTDERAEFRGGHVGFVFQFHHLLPEFTAAENVAMPLIIAGKSHARALAEAQTLLTRVGLRDRVTHRPAALSGGEAQRVAIARALVSRPQIVLADEPTGSLDVRTGEEVCALLLEVCREQGNLTIVVTHSADLARSVDEVFEMLPGGKLIGRGGGES